MAQQVSVDDYAECVDMIREAYGLSINPRVERQSRDIVSSNNKSGDKIMNSLQRPTVTIPKNCLGTARIQVTANASRAEIVCTDSSASHGSPPHNRPFYHNTTVAEVPGSLLLPSQGYAQLLTPPATPPKPFVKRTNTDNSVSPLSPLPSSASRPELEGSSPIDITPIAEMGPPGSPKRRLARFRGGDDTSSTASDSHVNIGPQFRDLNLDELLKRLPVLRMDVIQGTWLTAVRREHENMKRLLSEAGYATQTSHKTLENFGNDLSTIARDATSIASTYERAIKSVESLLEGQDDVKQDTIDRLERELADAADTIELGARANFMKDQNIRQVIQSIKYLVTAIDTFLRKHDQKLQGDTAYVELQTLLYDYRNLVQGDAPRYTRVLQDAYLKDMAQLREAKANHTKFRDVAREQGELIRHQANELDDLVTRLERCVQTINGRDTEVATLTLNVKAKDQLVADYENGSKMSANTQTEYQELLHAKDVLEHQVKAEQTANAREIEAKDLEIGRLRIELEKAQQQLGLSVLGQTQDDTDMHYSLAQHVTRGLHRLTARYPHKKPSPEIRPRFPHSRSLTHLPFLPSKLMASTTSNTQRESRITSDKEAISGPIKLELKDDRADGIDDGSWSCGIAGPAVIDPSSSQRKRSSSDSPQPSLKLHSRLDITVRPRTDSLGAVGLYNLMTPTNATPRNLPRPASTVLASAYADKELPPDPGHRSDVEAEAGSSYSHIDGYSTPRDYPGEVDSSNYGDEDDLIPLQQDLAQSYFDPKDLSQSYPPAHHQQVRRVLSKIPERSFEGSETSSPQVIRSQRGRASDLRDEAGMHTGTMNRDAIRAGLDILSARGIEDLKAFTTGGSKGTAGGAGGVDTAHQQTRKEKVLRAGVPETVTVRSKKERESKGAPEWTPRPMSKGKAKAAELAHDVTHSNANAGASHSEGNTLDSRINALSTPKRERPQGSPVSLDLTIAEMYPSWDAAVTGGGRGGGVGWDELKRASP